MNKSISITLLIALVGFPQISETIYTPALPNVAADLSASAHMVESTLATYFAGFALGVLIWGAFSDWSGRKTAMLLGILIYGIGTIACGATTSVEALLSWRFVQAFGASVGSVITQTIIREYYDDQLRAKLFALVSGVLAFSPAIGPVIGGFISETWGWRVNFSLLAILAFILIVWTWLSLPETRPEHSKLRSREDVLPVIAMMFSSKTLWGHILLIAATNGIIFGFYQEAPFIFIELLGISPTHYGLIGVLITLSGLAAAMFSYSQKSPQTMISLGALVVMFAAAVLTGFIGEIFNSGIFGLMFAAISLFFIFFGIGLIIPNSLSIALKPYKEMAGTAGSVFGGSYYMLISAFTWLLSWMHDGTALPLPIYIFAEGILLVIASQMIKMPHLKEYHQNCC